MFRGRLQLLHSVSFLFFSSVGGISFLSFFLSLPERVFWGMVELALMDSWKEHNVAMRGYQLGILTRWGLVHREKN